MPELRLTAIQRWMQQVVVHPGSVEGAVASAEAQKILPAERVGDVILPSRSLQPTERMGIYHGMYLIRMEEALQSDYAALQHFLGERGFRRLVRDYVLAFPSRSFSLNRLSDHLPAFIKSRSRIKSRGFCHDLARLELAITHVFDEAEAPVLSPADVAAVPPEFWENARLTPIPAFRLLSFRYPVNDYLQSVRDDTHDHPRPRLRDAFVAIYRRDYGVYRLDLQRTAHDLLSDLASGRSLGEAVTRAVRKGRNAAGQEELFRWFREWVSGGIFRKIAPASG
ncbi:MAG TPA: DNA-binding domain-containing protein [Vicinamibacteria bacterium]|nr:DNA-binding domain-containing protein [Vicinamibacteria bacterium]